MESLSFNSRPHKEVDTEQLCPDNICNLSIHDLTRRSTRAPVHLPLRLPFQFTTSQGGRPGRVEEVSGEMIFQFTTSQGGRLYRGISDQQTYAFQFTTSQGGRPPAFIQSPAQWHLSIHDLTRRSTKSVNVVVYIINLSIHDLTRRSTVAAQIPITRTSPFNSRPHKEVDFGKITLNSAYNLSIHDLTRRSTRRWH